MSNLLSEAIVDAKALRDAALKNAETIVIEKYSDQVKKTLDQLLEQDELGLDLGGDLDPAAGDAPATDPGPAMDLGMVPEEPEGEVEQMDEEDNIPLAATDDFDNLDGENLHGFPATGEPVELTLDLGALQEAVKALGDAEEFEINEEELANMLAEEDEEPPEELEEDDDPGTFAGEEAEEDTKDTGAAALAGSAAAISADATAMAKAKLEEELDEEALIDAVVEKLTVDMGATLSGWAGRSSESMKWEMEKALAHRRSTDVQDDLQTLKKAQEELVFENKHLNEHNTQYKHAIQELRESLQDVNLSNARLLYTNRILRNSSLNERQKEKIVEAISNAGSVTEARTIYETLQSTVEATPKRGPQSLSEAIGRRSTVIRATRQESNPSDPFQDRMKRLAGIK